MSILNMLLVLLSVVAVVVVPCQAFLTSSKTTTSAFIHPLIITHRLNYLLTSYSRSVRYNSSCSSSTLLHTSSSTSWSPPAIPPPPPDLKRVPLPAMLAGGLFLFASSVPSSQKSFANQLLSLSEEALRSDPTISMELGMGIETGGVYASSHTCDGSVQYRGQNVDQLVLQFQINGGATWACGVAYGIRNHAESISISSNNMQHQQGGEGEVTLVSLEVANMDAVLNGQSFQVPLNTLSREILDRVEEEESDNASEI